MPRPASSSPVRIDAIRAKHWKQGVYDVYEVEGNVHLTQADQSATARNAVFWIDRSQPFEDRPSKVIAYFEGDVVVDDVSATGSVQKLQDESYLYRYLTRSRIDLRFATVNELRSGEQGQPAYSPLYGRGLERRTPTSSSVDSPKAKLPNHRGNGQAGARAPRAARQPKQPIRDAAVHPAQFSADDIDTGPVVMTPRDGSTYNIQMLDGTGDETVSIVTGGVRLEIRDVSVDGAPEAFQDLGTIEIEADNAVLWRTPLSSRDPEPGLLGEGRESWEIYLEGNIIFLQGRRVVYAERMYYNVGQKFGVVRDTEMLAPVRDYDGLLRLKADVLQMVDQQHFEAYGAAITSSLIGHPRYWLQSEQISLEDEQVVRTDPITGMPAVDPITNRPDVDHEFLATSRNNFLYVGGWPVIYWPTVATDLRKPTYYIDKVKIKNDNVFGTQVFADFDAFQVLGISKPPKGVDWTFSTDFLSDRGPASGTRIEYDRGEGIALFGRNRGMFDAWGIYDTGVDNLGRDRRALTPEEEFRGRALWRHRHYLPGDVQFSGELGFITDRDFLEQYLETEWDQDKDQTTGIEFKKYFNHQTVDLAANIQLNEFFTQTQWWPRLDHHILGHSLLGDRVTWNAHSHVGYAKISNATVPTDPANVAKFDWLAWEEFNTPAGQDDREGIRAATRHELDVPVDLGPIRFVPYVLGEAAYWGEDLTGEDVTRLYGQTGVRASMPMWTVNREVQSQLFNLNGLAHKVTFETEVLYADADQDLTRFTLYDPLDDDSIEFFRRRFLFDTFGLPAGANTPLRFDERFYAHRFGLQSWVSSPSTEIADDLVATRMAIRQRWQTKRGLPGRERIVDWVVLDVEGTLFPDGNRDNFGEDVGMLNYDYRWHVGDRLAILSDGYADLYTDGLKTFSIGGLVSRPGQGRMYVGYRSIEGPITSNILNGSLSYRMSEKWILSAGASYDLGPTGNIGQSFGVTRIGESTFTRFGFNIDESRNSFGVRFSVEPRFLPRGRLGEVAGVRIPPAGVDRLE